VGIRGTLIGFIVPLVQTSALTLTCADLTHDTGVPDLSLTGTMMRDALCLNGARLRVPGWTDVGCNNGFRFKLTDRCNAETAVVCVDTGLGPAPAPVAPAVTEWEARKQAKVQPDGAASARRPIQVYRENTPAAYCSNTCVDVFTWSHV
jgi:hypothetical protein